MATNKKLIIGNWKMNPATFAEAKKLFLGIKASAGTLRKTDTVVCPPAPFVQPLAALVSGHRCVVGAQNVHAEAGGAYTGEFSVSMLASIKAKYVIIGHSERREMGETDEIIAKKTVAALQGGFVAVLCVGEKDRDPDGDYLRTLERQIKGSLAGVPKESLGKLVIAYEPVWAIGAKAKGVADPPSVLEINIFILKVLTGVYGRESAEKVALLYGGSADETNAKGFLTEGGSDGLLVGRASLDAKKFAAILNAADESYKK